MKIIQEILLKYLGNWTIVTKQDGKEITLFITEIHTEELFIKGYDEERFNHKISLKEVIKIEALRAGKQSKGHE